MEDKKPTVDDENSTIEERLLEESEYLKNYGISLSQKAKEYGVPQSELKNFFISGRRNKTAKDGD